MNVLIVLVLCISLVNAGPQWIPIGINTFTALGAYGRVREAYSGVLIFGSLQVAYHKVGDIFIQTGQKNKNKIK